jgi:poly(3-hydroxybutyrate) depolymerase
MRWTAVVALALVSAGAVLAQDTDGLRLRLDAYFSAKDAETKKKALDALEATAVPKDQKGRQDALRRALAPQARKSYSRIEEKILEHECFFVTPRGYDAKKPVSAVISFHGRNGNGHEGIQPFALPDEEWDDLKKPIEDEFHKKYGANAKIRVEKPKVKINFDDGIVIGPTTKKDGLDPEETEAVTLAAIERLNRAYAADPDRLFVAGISLGGAIACELAERHPDRFAGVVAASGYDPNNVENLRPLQVYMTHGAKDDDVAVKFGREMDQALTAANVTHVYKEFPNLGHAWPAPEDCTKVRAWMRERVRNPWPKELQHRFLPEAKRARRCFWIELPADSAVVTVDAKVKENEIDLAVGGGVKTAVLHLAEPLVDLEKDVVVRWNGTEVFRGKLTRKWSELLADVEATGFDLPRAAPARLEVKAP